MRLLSFVLAAAVLALARTVPALPYVEPGDPLDFSFSALDALSAVERAYVLRDGDGRAVRAKVLRLLHEYDRQSGRGKKPFGDMPASFLAGIPLDTPVGPDAGRWVFARLMKFAGGLYDHPELAARGESELVRILREHPDFGDFRTNVPVAVTAYGYRGVKRVDHEDVYGGDGKWHDVAVEWVEYLPVNRTSNLCLTEASAPSEVFKRRVAASRESAYRRSILSFLAG